MDSASPASGGQGHIGYSVVPWKRGRGYATRALGLFLRDVEEESLPFVELITNTTNESSRRVIEKNGGVFVERFRGPDQQGGHEELRFRIPLPRPLNATPSHSSTARSGPP